MLPRLSTYVLTDVLQINCFSLLSVGRPASSTLLRVATLELIQSEVAILLGLPIKSPSSYIQISSIDIPFHPRIFQLPPPLPKGELHYCLPTSDPLIAAGPHILV